MPWVYSWIGFVSNVSNAIEAPSNKNYFIIKTDVSSFYDDIPHDNLKRLLLGGVSNKVDEKLSTLDDITFKSYKKYIDNMKYEY